MEFAYMINTPPAQNDLCALEMKYLFNTKNKKALISDINVNHHASIYIKCKIDVIKKNQSFEYLVDEVKKLNLSFERYKVIYIKNEDNPIDYAQSLNMCARIGNTINGSVDMKRPLTTLGIVNIDGYWIVGYYHHGEPSWMFHNDKPHSFSNSLDIRIARTLVNIASHLKDNPSIVDPCCGVGTVILEGISLKQNIKGYDCSLKNGYKARMNLEHYGYNKELVQISRIQDVNENYDVSIVDIPYNLYAAITHEEQVDILYHASRISLFMILISYEQMDKELDELGYEIIDKVSVKKTEYLKFERHVYICRSHFKSKC